MAVARTKRRKIGLSGSVTSKLVLRRGGPEQSPTLGSVSTEGMRPEEEGMDQVCQ